MTETLAAAAGQLALGDLTVNRIGLGARFVQDAEHSRPLLQRALELGVNLIDTADVYGNSENAIAEALHPYPEGLVIATKGGQTLVDGQPTGDGRPEYLREACERSLRAPARRHDRPLPAPHARPERPDRGVGRRARTSCAREGKVRADRRVERVRRAARACAPHRADRLGAEPLQPDAPRQRDGDRDLRARGNGLHAVVAAGRRRAGAARARSVRSRGCLQRSPAMLPIPGTASVEHLEENVAAASDAADARRKSPSPRVAAGLSRSAG